MLLLPPCTLPNTHPMISPTSSVKLSAISSSRDKWSRDVSVAVNQSKVRLFSSIVQPNSVRLISSDVSVGLVPHIYHPAHMFPMTIQGMHTWNRFVFKLYTVPMYFARYPLAIHDVVQGCMVARYPLAIHDVVQGCMVA